MQERYVTVGGTRHALGAPFMVMATQNPIEQEGTYPLPEAQLDRFFLKLIVPYPTKDELARIVAETTGSHVADARVVANKDDLVKMNEIVREVTVAGNVLDFVLSIILKTQEPSRLMRYGASPRGAQSIVTASKVYALLDVRFNIAKEDVVKSIKPALRHRIGLSFEAEADGMDADAVLTTVLESVQGADRDPISV
jgi:MoxR-like ATPase